ncbi:MAG: hypothetical protein KDA60_00830 [Planctomycetales bacterium]|nr:hypothetical protein [Planctomycetales bacterium]
MSNNSHSPPSRRVASNLVDETVRITVLAQGPICKKESNEQGSPIYLTLFPARLEIEGLDTSSKDGTTGPHSVEWEVAKNGELMLKVSVQSSQRIAIVGPTHELRDELRKLSPEMRAALFRELQVPESFAADQQSSAATADTIPPASPPAK